MSDLGAIFHVKKNGTQYDAHAYTTLDECPYPNLKIKTKSGTQAYVKLTTNGQGDVPLRVKPKSESTTYQVQSTSMSTGSATVPALSAIQWMVTYSNVDYWDSTNSLFALTIPLGIKVVAVNNTKYVGVTPGKTYYLESGGFRVVVGGASGLRLCSVHASGSFTVNKSTYSRKGVQWAAIRGASSSMTISWSPEINKQTPTVTDY